jgi:hypothetical protein
MQMVKLNMFRIMVWGLNAFNARNPLACLPCKMTGGRVVESVGSVTTLGERGSSSFAREGWPG